MIMTNQSSTTGFTHDNPYEDEARQRWGHTDAWKESQERVKKMSKADMDAVKKAGEELTLKIAAQMDAKADPASPEVQALIAEHYNGLRAFYEPNLEMYRGLGSMYVEDARFAAFYDKVRPGLAVFMRDAMHGYCDLQSK